jgi:hypothetical protein
MNAEDLERRDFVGAWNGKIILYQVKKENKR